MKEVVKIRQRNKPTVIETESCNNFPKALKTEVLLFLKNA